MRAFLILSLLFLPLNAWATCPNNKDVIAHLKEIHDRLVHHSEEPIVINGKDYTVDHGQYGGAATDLLAGEYRGFYLDRLRETPSGDCTFRLRDDKSPTQGYFILKEKS